MKKFLFFIWISAIWAAPAWGVPADEPLKNGLSALASGDFVEARKWFSLTHRDFPSSRQGEEALVHETLITVGRELAHLKLGSLFREGAPMNRLEGRPGPSYRQRAERSEEEARKAAGHLIGIAPALLKVQGADPSLKFRVDPAGWDVDDLEAKIRKGEGLEETDVKKLDRGEMLKSYFGFLGAVFELPEGALVQSAYEGPASLRVLFKAVGGRIFLSQSSSGDRQALALARRCFERVKNLTADRPYDRNRQEALEFLGRIDKLEAASGAANRPVQEKYCPVDGAPMQPEWKFCPAHGTPLNPARPPSK